MIGAVICAWMAGVALGWELAHCHHTGRHPGQASDRPGVACHQYDWQAEESGL